VKATRLAESGGDLREPRPDVGQPRQLGLGIDVLDTLSAKNSKVIPERNTLLISLVELELSLGIPDQLLAEAGIKFARAPQKRSTCSRSHLYLRYRLAASSRVHSGVSPAMTMSQSRVA
jgi:hypothetical protein